MFRAIESATHKSPRRLTSLVLALAAWAGGSGVASADLVILVPTGITASPGGSTAFDVLLEDTDAPGGAPYRIGGFNVRLTIASASGATFRSASNLTSAPYVFGGISTLPPGFSAVVSGGGSVLDISDLGNTAADFRQLTPGGVFGLGRVVIEVSRLATPPTSIAVGVDPASDVADPRGNSFDNPPKTTLTRRGGSLLVVSAVPAPSGLIQLGIGISASLAAWRFRRLRERHPLSRAGYPAPSASLGSARRP